MRLLRKSALIASLIAVSFGIAACNTSKGLGRDMQKAGQGIENSAEKHGAD